jgi:hypothetical protein
MSPVRPARERCVLQRFPKCSGVRLRFQMVFGALLMRGGAINFWQSASADRKRRR